MKRMVAVALAVVVAVAGVASAAEFEWTLASHIAEESVQVRSFNRFAKSVAEKSNGRMVIHVSPGAQLGGQREIVESVNLGAIEMGMGESGLYANYIPAFGIMVMPFMHSSREKFYEAQDGAVGTKLSAMLEEQTGMKIFVWLDGGGYRDVYSVKPIANIDAMKGVKIRTPESAAFVTMFKAFNSNPTAIAAPEMYTALQQGVVDAMEGTYETAVTYGIMEIAKNCLETHHIYNESSVVVNKDAWDELPADLQKIMMECGEEMKLYERELVVELDKGFRERMEKNNVKFIPVDMPRAKEMVADVYKNYIGGDKAKQEIYDMLVQLNK